MIIDLNKKTVQELRQRCRELLDEGILDATRTEISRAKKAELIEWIEFYDDNEDELENEQEELILVRERRKRCAAAAAKECAAAENAAVKHT